MNKAIFIDKDGTLVENVPYNVDVKKIRLMPDAIEALQLFKNAGYKIIIISNQSGIAKGMFTEKELIPTVLKIQRLLVKHGITLDDFYYCPHHPEGTVTEYAISCVCRKPQSGLFFQAAQDNEIDTTESWMIGDILHDIEAGNRAGCKTVLIDNGNETEWNITPKRTPNHIVDNLKQAAEVILNQNIKEAYLRSTKEACILTDG